MLSWEKLFDIYFPDMMPIYAEIANDNKKGTLKKMKQNIEMDITWCDYAPLTAKQYLDLKLRKKAAKKEKIEYALVFALCLFFISMPLWMWWS